MYNQNNNLWPSVTPLVAFGYGSQSLNPMQINANVLPQNVNHLYYNQNQGFSQQLNTTYGYFGSSLVPQTNPNISSHYLSQVNHSLTDPNVRTNQLTCFTNLNQSTVSEDNQWLQLLNLSQKQVLDQLNKEQEEFELQFRNWEKDFENWKQVNRTHPDSNAYQLYVNQWQEWRQRLVERQQQMKDLRNRTLQQLYSQIRPQMSQNVGKPTPPPPPPPEKKETRPPPPPPASPSHPKGVRSSNVNTNISSKGSNSKKSDNKSDGNDIEIIEIDCEPKTTEQKKSESNADPTAVSKAAEALLFIKKQQELLKSLENLEKVKTVDKKSDENSDDLQVIEPKCFDINEIVNKMKAIRPPENPIEANKLLLQGIVFQPKPNPQNVSNNTSIERSFDVQKTDNSSVNNNSNQTNQLIQSDRHLFPQSSNQGLRPQFSEATNSRHPMPPNIQNRWTSPNMGREDQTINCSNDEPSPQTANSIRKYSAQTIDYNHRHENREINPRNDLSVEGNSYFPPKQMSSAFNKSCYNEINSNHSSNHQMFDEMRKPLNDNSKAHEIEETITYRDMRYFTHPKSRIVPIDDLLRPPTREFRPENIVIILRGLPGSGKTFIAKLIKEKEMEFGRSAPRILSIDDYFMTEVERQIKSSETGKTVNSKEYVYEYEKEMESCYRLSLLKTYKKTVDDRLFPFIIVDAINELISDIEDYYSYAIKNDFVVYVIEMVSNDPLVCHKNNIHNRTAEDIEQIHNKWQTLPDFMLRLDIRSLLQNISIKNIEMDINCSESEETLKRKSLTEQNIPNKQLKSSRDLEDELFNGETRVSRWERMEASESKLDKLDSFKMKSKPTIEEYLQVTEDYDLRLRDKQKRVRWADIEEKKKQEHMRQRGFVVGLDWHQYMDPQHPQRVLTETKYF